MIHGTRNALSSHHMKLKLEHDLLTSYYVLPESSIRSDSGYKCFRSFFKTTTVGQYIWQMD